MTCSGTLSKANERAAVTVSGHAAWRRANRREFRTRSELARAEDALRENEKRYRDLFDNAEVGMFRSTLDGSEVIDVNGKLIVGFDKRRLTAALGIRG